MQLSYLLLFSLVALASASRLPNSGSTQATKCSGRIIAKFDDLPTQPPAAAPRPIGSYRGLKYNNVNLVTLGVAGLPPPAGVLPASNPNVAAFGFFELASTPNVTVVGGDAGYKTFDVTQVAYGCLVGSGETVVNVPASCTLRFSGYKAGRIIAYATLQYKVANGQLTKAMSVASLTFDEVDTVGFKVLAPSPVEVAVVIDNFVYVGCS